MVRVGGYSARFVNLGPELQEEIIARRRYNS
jgi:pyruvate-formate lyase